MAELLPADVAAAHDTSVIFMLHVPHDEAGSAGMVQEWHNELASVVVIAVVIVVVAAAFLCLNTLQRMCVPSFAGVCSSKFIMLLNCACVVQSSSQL